MKTHNETGGLKILVVEDSRTQAEYLLHILEKEGYRVVLAVNGNEALELIKTDRPTIVLTDIIMPEMDGYALCSAIKNNENLADIPVILVTQLFDPPDLIKGLEAGANDIIIKPFQPEHVISRITSTLRSLAPQGSGVADHSLEVSFDGETHLIPENQLRTPAIILSSYTAAMRKNTELLEANERLAAVNEDLRQKVETLQQANEKLLSSRPGDNPPGAVEQRASLPGQNRGQTESDRLRSVLSSIVNSSNDAIIGKTLDGTILSWNRAAERYYGYLAEEVIGKSIEIIIPPELRVHLPLFLQRVANGEIIDRFDTVRLRKDGSRIGVCVTLSPIKDDEGRIFGISTIAQNIADREKSEVGRMIRQQLLHSR